MESRSKALGHAVHPSLVVFPLGLLSTAVIFDILYLITYRDGFNVAAAYTMAAGLVGGLVAGLFGFLDFTAIPNRTRAQRVALLHGMGNVVVLVLFAISWFLRLYSKGWEPSRTALGLSFAGLAVVAVSGWLGGELVERLGVSVYPDADVNASNSLTGSRHEHARR
jgi:uncharacterized membrane protein